MILNCLSRKRGLRQATRPRSCAQRERGESLPTYRTFDQLRHQMELFLWCACAPCRTIQNVSFGRGCS